MICPKCKVEYEKGNIKCAECGRELVENDALKLNEKSNWFYKFGETTAKKAISALFFIGLLPLLFTSILFGNYLYLTNMYSKSISFMRDGQKWYTSEQVNNLPLGFLGGFVFFIVIVLVWKILCELLIIIFRAIETYTQKNKI